MIIDLGKYSKHNRCYAHDMDSPFANSVYKAITQSDNPSEAHTFGGGECLTNYLDDDAYIYDSKLGCFRVDDNGDGTGLPDGLPYGWHTLTWQAWIELHEVDEDFELWPKEKYTLPDGQVVEVVSLN